MKIKASSDKTSWATACELSYTPNGCASSLCPRACPARLLWFKPLTVRLSARLLWFKPLTARLLARQNVYLHTKSRKRPCPACIFSHIFPPALFAEFTSFKLLVSCKIKTLKFQGFQLYAQSPAFCPVFLFFAFSHYLSLFTRGNLKNVHLVCLYTF